MRIGDNYDLGNFQRYTSYFCSNNAKTMELQIGEFPGWDRSPVAFIRTSSVVSQFPTIATTVIIILVVAVVGGGGDDDDDDDDNDNIYGDSGGGDYDGDGVIMLLLLWAVIF